MTRQQNEDRRLQIMEAALPLFAEKGFKGTTNRDIAEAAGIASTGLIYWYFKNKEELFNAILDEFVPIDSVTFPLETMTDVPPQHLLPLLVKGFSVFLNESRFIDVMRIIVAESLSNPSEGARFNRFLKRILDPFVAYLRSQIVLGRLRDDDPLLMAQSFMSSIGLFFIRRRVGLDETLLGYDIDRVAQFAVAMFLRAFALSPEEQGG